MEKVSAISPIALDLGGMNTGVLLAHGALENPPGDFERIGYTLIFPEKGLKLSQKERLAKRHQRRGFKRRKLSKRLLALILRQLYKENDEDFVQDFHKLRTFLNRRGYTYLTLEEIEELADTIREYDFDMRVAIIEVLGKECGLSPYGDFLRQLEKTDQKPLTFYRELISSCNEATAKENKNIDKEIKKNIRNIADYCAQILKSEEEGHHARSEYFSNIRADLKRPEFEAIAKKCELSSSQLANLIGHVANLQLRVLRRYFNDPKMAERDYWDEKRLEKIFLRYLHSWHIKKKDREFENRAELLRTIQDRGLLRTFLDTNPELSIPPFEDMNNRRPPTCKSLHLDESKLDQEYPQWRDWTEKLIAQFQHIYELENFASDPEIKYIAEYYANSRQATAHKKTKTLHAILLQRILDRSSDVDEYRLRAQVQTTRMIRAEEAVPERLRNAYETGRKNLIQAVGEQAANKIVELADCYYQEVENAKRGLWLPEEKSNLTFRCDRKPRQKKNLREELVGHILATDFRDKNLWSEWEALYHKPKTINNRSSIASICGNIEKARKDLGDEFHFYWNKIRHSGFKPNPEDKVEREVLKHVRNAEEIADVIAKFLQHDAKTRSKYANPYSLAQLYLIMEGDIAGFHRTCPACTRENFWRSSPAAAAAERRDGTTPARAVRLPADTMRPFDGFLARYLERIGEKIAHLKWRQLSAHSENGAVLVPILLEQNRFRFNSDMAEIKESMRRKQAKEKWQRAEKRFEDKWERIRKAGKGICPYTGEAIGSSGEFDHILPRSYSKGSFGTVFNTEINLIYATSTGNRKKGDRFYTLDDLHPKYREKLYHTTDTKAIRAQIVTTLQKFTKARSVYFHNLSEEEQRDFRHALFDQSLLKQVQDLLHTQYKMRVSGMQGYLARVIYEKLLQLNREKKLPLHFAVFAYDAGDDSLASRRKNLEAHNRVYAKPHESAQPPGSHVIDAAMVWAHALEREDIPGLPKGLLLEGDSLEELLPERIEILSLAAREKYRRRRPQSMQIFKDTIYAERYLSLIVGKNRFGFGYDLKNLVEFDKNLLPQIFELLKPFIAYYGKPVSGSLADYPIPQNKKFIYFNIIREKAAEFLQQKAYAESLTQQENNQMALLTGLRYSTLKSEISGTLSDQQGKAKSIIAEEKDIQKFSTKVEIRLQLEPQGKPLCIQGRVELPQLAVWQDLLSDKTVKELIKKAERWQELDRSKMVEIINRHFRQTVTNPLKHHGVRKVYSLPLPQVPSGGFRIQRKRREGRQFHVQAIEGSKFAGFAVNNGQVDFSKPVIMPLLVKPGSLAPVDGYVGKMPEEFVYMDEWREIAKQTFNQKNLPVSRLWLQLNSESRMRVRLEIRNTALSDSNHAWHLVAPLVINMTKKAEDKAIEKLQNNLSKILEGLQLKPRDKVTLVAADRQNTIYEFIVQSTNAVMQNWYNSGTPCAI